MNAVICNRTDVQIPLALQIEVAVAPDRRADCGCVRNFRAQVAEIVIGFLLCRNCHLTRAADGQRAFGGGIHGHALQLQLDFAIPVAFHLDVAVKNARKAIDAILGHARKGQGIAFDLYAPGCSQFASDRHGCTLAAIVAPIGVAVAVLRHEGVIMRGGIDGDGCHGAVVGDRSAVVRLTGVVCSVRSVYAVPAVPRLRTASEQSGGKQQAWQDTP